MDFVNKMVPLMFTIYLWKQKSKMTAMTFYTGVPPLVG